MPESARHVLRDGAGSALSTALIGGLLPLLAGGAQAQELSLLGGTTREIDRNNHTYAWTLEYMQGLGEHVAFSLAWLNEGHVPGHHRDGHSAQLWARTSVFDRRVWIAGGAGPYRYFDTARARQGASYNDDHGWGAIFSLDAAWYAGSRWIYRLRLNRVVAEDGFDSERILLGVGYQLDAPDAPGPRAEAPSRSTNTTGNEVTVFAGATIVNSLASEHGAAYAVEYRRGVGRYADWTLTWLDEGDVRLVRRNGVASQLWLTRGFFNDRLTLAAGAGGYIAVDRYRDRQPAEDGDEALSGIVTVSGSLRLDRRWLARLSWNRIVTDYSRDTDVILAGLGYCF